MKVVKYSGEVEEFDAEKIKRTIIGAGGSKKLAENAVQEVMRQYHEGMTTKEILTILLGLLKKEPGVAERYDLKRAIMSLGPSGFPFEIFFAHVLEHYGYSTKIDEKLIGNNIIHEIDIVAEKIPSGKQAGKKFMIECKYHNKPGIRTKVRYAKKTYGTFLALKNYNFDQPWLATNTKCSFDTIEYAKSVNLKITSWTYPKDESLRSMIENQKLYPITILQSLPNRIKEKLYNSKILIAQDLLQYSTQELKQKLQLPEKEIAQIVRKVKDIVEE